MNILFVTHAPPFPPDDGARLIVANLARVWKQAGTHTLYVASLCEDERAAALTPWFDDVRLAQRQASGRGSKWAQSMGDPAPLWVRAYNSLALRRGIAELIRAHVIDVAHCDTGLMAQYADALAGVPRVAAPHDSLTHALELQARRAPRRLERFAARLQLEKMRRYEAAAYPAFHRVIVVTQREREQIERVAPSAVVRVIPNGIDTDYFAPMDVIERPDSIGLLGVMDYALNAAAALDFARDVLPLLWRERPQVTFTIIGRNPPQAVRALARDPRIRITGTVADVRPFLASQSIMVCPMPEAGGIKNKMLEALAMAKSIVATPQAAEGLAVRDGIEYAAAQTAHELASALLLLLNDAAQRQRLGAAGRAWALNHTWRATADAYLGVYREALCEAGSQIHTEK